MTVSDQTHQFGVSAVSVTKATEALGVTSCCVSLPAFMETAPLLMFAPANFIGLALDANKQFAPPSVLPLRAFVSEITNANASMVSMGLDVNSYEAALLACTALRSLSIRVSVNLATLGRSATLLNALKAVVFMATANTLIIVSARLVGKASSVTPRTVLNQLILSVRPATLLVIVFDVNMV